MSRSLEKSAILKDVSGLFVRIVKPAGGALATAKIILPEIVLGQKFGVITHAERNNVLN